jgi:hypothetical protein
VVQQLSDQDRKERWAKITAHSWEDPSFKQQLLSNPKPILAEAGLGVPDNFTVKIVEQGSPEASEVGHYQLTEDERDHYQLVMALPAKPSDVQSGELSESQLEGVTGGDWTLYCCCTCCPCCSC